jgi:hypothetical protein
MAHWAELDENNIVTRVLVGSNEDPDEGYQWLIDNLGGTWVKTSYNTVAGTHTLGGTPFRKNYAGIGYSYDEALDAFIPPKPEGLNSWVVNEETGQWQAPVAAPTDAPEGKYYAWDEQTVSWVLADTPVIQNPLP